MGVRTGRISPYLSAVISMPFTPGHEVVGQTLDDLDGLPKGSRVVLDPVLGCAARGVRPCPSCAAGEHSRCDHVTAGAPSPPPQTGFCGGTRGGRGRPVGPPRSPPRAAPGALETAGPGRR